MDGQQSRRSKTCCALDSARFASALTWHVQASARATTTRTSSVGCSTSASGEQGFYARTPGWEDDLAFEYGIGFTDIVRRAYRRRARRLIQRARPLDSSPRKRQSRTAVTRPDARADLELRHEPLRPHPARCRPRRRPCVLGGRRHRISKARRLSRRSARNAIARRLLPHRFLTGPVPSTPKTPRRVEPRVTCRDPRHQVLDGLVPPLEARGATPIRQPRAFRESYRPVRLSSRRSLSD